MAINFPDSPSNGDTFTANGIVYTYNASTTLWDTISAAGSAIDLSAVNEAIIPDTDVTYDLGSSTHKWKDLYLSGSTLHLGAAATISAGSGSEIVLPSIKVGAGSNAVKLSASATGGLQTQAVVGGVSQSVQPAGGTVQVADLAAMQAIANPSIGDMVSVVSNKTIYMYNGTGFYKIAVMVNESPSAITGVDGAYVLAKDGTATTITAISTDPEGRTLSWSYAVTSGSLTNGGGATATVTQGPGDSTGPDTNVFTITPTTNSAYAGTFSLTFSVTDNVNGAVNAVSVFTLAFIVQNSRYTALSVKATATGSNQTFDDASASNHTITANGNATASTFSPHRHGGYSAYFDGTGDYLTGPSSATIGIGTGDFTIECWFYATDGTSVNRGIWENRTDGYPNHSDGLSLTRITETTFRVYGTSQLIVSSATTITNNWNHLAVVRNSGTLEFFVNGVSQGTASNSTNMNSSQPIAIGSGRYTTSNSTPTHAVNGYIQDFRVLTSALYTSNFTPPTAPLTAITNTKFLLGQLPYFKDQSASNHTITVGDNASLKPKSVFDNGAYSEASHGASVYFDGSGDYISAANNADFNVGSSDFTLECWAYIESINGNAGICGFYTTTGDQRSYIIYQTSGTEHFGVAMSSNGTFESGSGIDSNVDIIEYLNQWVHLALTKSGTNATLYLNGNSIGTTSSAPSTLHSSTGEFIVGKTNGINVHTTGYFSDVRLVNGSVVYTSNFTPPTAPLTAITNTKFLLNPETSISDLSQSSEITCFGDAATSTTQVKFAGTKSIYLDGTGDYLQISNLEDSWISGYTGDFTVELWWYPTNVSNGTVQEILTAGNGFQLYISNGGALNLALDDNNATTFFWHPQSIHTMVNDTWQHLAVVRNGNVYTVYVDGVSKATTTSNDLIGTGTNPVQLGIYAGNSLPTQGYFQDLRITKGLARYTANFTPPTTELQG